MVMHVSFCLVVDILIQMEDERVQWYLYKANTKPDGLFENSVAVIVIMERLCCEGDVNKKSFNIIETDSYIRLGHLHNLCGQRASQVHSPS